MNQWLHKTSQATIPKTNKGKHCYPLTTAQLFALLDQWEVRQISQIYFSLRTSKALLLGASYTGNKLRQHPKYNEATTWPRAGESIIRVCTVDPAEREQAKNLLQSEALPILGDWLKDAEQQNENWRLNDHNIAFCYRKGNLLLEENAKWLPRL